MGGDYHWLVPEEMLSFDSFFERHRDLFGSLPPDASILDCACGIGTDAIGLARRGYRVQGSDASETLVAEARKRVHAAGVEVPLAACSWEELPERFDERFDLALCTGNAISHCLSEGAIMRSLIAMRNILKDGGLLVVDSRNWEKVLSERPGLEVADRVYVRNGARCIPMHLWSFPDRQDEPHGFEIVLLFLDEAGHITDRRYRLEYRPFRVRELLDLLAGAGFGEIWTNYAEDADRYEVRACRREAG